MVECEISIESLWEPAILGVETKREVAKTLSGAKQNGLRFAAIKCKAVMTEPVM